MAKVNTKPITKGVAKVPVVMQLEALECGAASLTMVLAYYGKWIPLEQVRADCGVSRDGSNAKSLLKAARHYGLTAKGYRLEPDEIKQLGQFPCIIHWNFNHFVVLDGFRGGTAYINDPARGQVKVPMEEFDESFTGLCIMFEPGEGFAPSGKPKSTLDFAKARLKGTSTAVAFAVIMSLIAALFGIINPAFSRVFLDRLLTYQNPDWMVPFFILLIAFNVIQVVVTALQGIYNLRINGKMAAVGNATYMWKVLNLPMQFFSQRQTGDIQGRQSSNANIANSLINTFAPLALNVIMMVFYLVVMLRYSWVLTLIGIGAMTVNAVVSRVISARRVNITRVAMRDQAKLSSATVSGVEMIETIKSAGAENGYFARWAGYQASANLQQVKFEKQNQYLGIIPTFINTTANSLVLIIGVFLIMQGVFTQGMVMAFQGFLGSFMAPAQSLVSAGQTMQEMRTQMERIDDVMEYPSDDSFAPEATVDEGVKYRKLGGSVELKDVTFGYSPLAAPLISNFNLTVEPGQMIALVGGSGCGKSTVSKLVSGLYQPWSGQILFDGKPMKEIEKSVFSSSLAVIDQDITLFEGTVADNIRMWDDSIEEFEIILAARDAQIHDDITKRSDGYEHKIMDGAKDFSGGQRQRIEIARVLAQDPVILIMDEATSALDAKTEFETVKAIRRRGLTCIVVAHRLSTIRSADEIIVMDHGNIIDRGTHKQLMESCELYQELVTSE